MIITLLPLLLAANFTTLPEAAWNHGSEVTYLISDHATVTHEENSSKSDLEFRLQTSLTCQESAEFMQCFFHDTTMQSNLINVKRLVPEHIQDHVWAKKILQQAVVRVKFNEKGVEHVQTPVTGDPLGKSMIKSLINLLNVGLDFSRLETTSHARVTPEGCRENFQIERQSILNQHNLGFKLFVPRLTALDLVTPVQMMIHVETEYCSSNIFSFFSYLDMRRWREKQMKAQLVSADRLIVMGDINFFSHNDVKTVVTNQQDNTSYIVDESLMLELKRVGPILCDNEYSSSLEDCSTEF